MSRVKNAKYPLRFIAGPFFGAAAMLALGLTLPFHESARTPNSHLYSVAELHAASGDALRGLEIATANLLCAEGLGANERLGISAASAILDTWATRVESETERHYYRFRQNPGEYQNSDAYFKVLVLITVLQQDFGIHYNPQKISTPDFSDPDDLFLQGLLGEKRAGTCVSMPVLYAAVGRRLGYPSIEERREYGGWICCPTNGCNTGPPKPTSSPAVTGRLGPPWEINLANSKCPKGSTPVADWHTHPDASTQIGSPGQDSPDRRGVIQNAARLECDFVGFMTNARLTTSVMDAQGVETVIASGP